MFGLILNKSIARKCKSSNNSVQITVMIMMLLVVCVYVMVVEEYFVDYRETTLGFKGMTSFQFIHVFCLTYCKSGIV